MSKDTLILNQSEVGKKLDRIAYQIFENHFEDKELILVGISGRGFKLCLILSDLLSSISDLKITTVELLVDKNDPVNHISVKNDLSLDNRCVILIDDVLNTGKTLGHAVAFLMVNKPKKLKTVVLVDRKHRNFPVKADYVGLTLATTMQEHIKVEINSKENIKVYLVD